MRNFFWITLGALLFACQGKETTLKADLSVMADTTGTMVTMAMQTRRGAIEEMKLPAMKMTNAFVVIDSGDKALITFTDKQGIVEPANVALGFPPDWSDYSTIGFTLRNPNDFAISTEFNIYGARNRMPYPVDLQAGESHTGEMDLRELPMTARSMNIYTPLSIFISAQAEQDTFLLVVEGIWLTKSSGKRSLAIVDEIGQRKHAEWDGKLSGAAQLGESLETEHNFLDAIVDNPDLDKYGGWLKGPKFQPTGFFYVAQDNSRWWLVTPEGNAFWSLGVTGVRTKDPAADVTIVKGREYLFDTLPPSTGRYAPAWVDERLFSFYSWNILRKYDDKSEWMAKAIKRLRKWGMNTIGNWSEVDLLDDYNRMVYTYNFRTARGHDYVIHNQFSDVFHPGWELFLDSLMQKAAALRYDNYLLGYFVDNEATWQQTQLLQNDLHDIPLRFEWERLLKQSYESLDEINQAWNTSYASWDEIRNMNSDQLKMEGNLLQDYIKLETLYAEKYFGTIKTILKKHDPNHLYLGCRFTRQIKPEHIVRTAGRYVDVMSVNAYSLYPDREDFTQWYTWGQRPILIGEHHLPLHSERQFPPKYRAFSEEERLEYYPQYVHKWAELPFSVGCHWYQFVDQHLTGRSTDGENQTVGLVDITDRPHEHMVKAIRKASETMYQVHAESK